MNTDSDGHKIIPHQYKARVCLADDSAKLTAITKKKRNISIGIMTSIVKMMRKKMHNCTLLVIHLNLTFVAVKRRPKEDKIQAE